MALGLPVLAIIVFLAPMMYLLLAAPAFLLVDLGTPQVAYILRSVLAGYYLVLVGAGLVATALMTLDGRVWPSLGIGLVTVFDLALRRWMLRRIGPLVDRAQEGLRGSGPPLRRLHWMAMATNAVQLALFAPLIPTFAAA